MATSLVHFLFAVNSVEVSIDFDTRRNVRKPIHDIVYTSNLGDRSAVSTYVGSKPLTPQDNLLLLDRSNSIGENNIRLAGTPRFFSGPSAEVNTYYFLLTDSFVRSPDGGQLLPLFYRHLLDTDPIAVDSVKVFDSQGKEVSQTFWKVELLPDGTSYLMNSLESFYDASTADYAAYWVQYGKVSGSGTIGTRFVLVSNEPAYQIATFDDINPATSSLYQYAKAYVLTLLATGGYTVTLPDPSKQYAIKEYVDSKIELKLPIALDDEEFWFASVSNGSWTKTYRTNFDPEVYTYDIPEYHDQDFNPWEPYKREFDRRSFWAARRLVKLAREDIKEDGSTYTLDIVIWDNDEENVLYAITTDATKVGDIYTDTEGDSYISTSPLVEDHIRWSDDEIESIDRKTGFIHLNIDLRTDYVMRATYYFEERFLEVTSIDLNPVLNSSVRGNKVVYYLVPKSEDPNNNLLRTGSIHYLVVNPYGSIQSCSQDGADGNADLASVFGSATWFYERTASVVSSTSITSASTTVTVSSTADFPDRGVLRVRYSGTDVFIPYVSKTSTVFTFAGPASTYGVGTTISAPETLRLASFVDNYTVESTWGFTPGLGIAGTGGRNGFWYRYLILGEVCISQNQSIDNLTLIDARVSGGKVKQDLYEQAKALNPEVTWTKQEYEEFGQFYPGRGVVVIKLPYGLLQEFGGDFTESQITEIVSRHISGGMIPLVRYV